jgi:hypothetical protein
MIKGMARAGRVLDRPDFIESAERALNFIRAKLWRNQRLLATYKDGKSHLNAYLDDHVFMIDGAFELLRTSWRPETFEFIRALGDLVLEHFEDENQGGFYFTGDNHEKLVYRPKAVADEAIPSGNGIATLMFLRLGHLLADKNYLDAAERTLQALQTNIQQQPSAHASLLMALEEHLEPTQTVVLRGTVEEMKPWEILAQRHYRPGRLVLVIPDNVENLPGVLAERKARGGTTAYICTGLACSAPVNEIKQFEATLQ